jgi:serine protease
MLKRLFVLWLLILLVACGETLTPAPTPPTSDPTIPTIPPPDPTSPSDPDPTSPNPSNPTATGDISGTIRFAGPSATFANAEFMLGEIIVKMEPGLSAQSFSSLSVQGRVLTRVRSLSLPLTGLYQVVGLDKQGTLELVATLKARSDIADAVPNYLFYSTRTPNDPQYKNQWHYPAINLPAAWDKTTGSNAVTVAVIDTGIVPHPDFGNRLLPGYDFVSDAAMGADGDGRDSNPLDPGPYRATAYHGTHVAGTIGAASNNGSGVAGVSWSARILPVRALGPSANGNGAVGTLADVTDAALWAAGLTVAGVPANPTPADVLNFSLGGNVPCSSIQQEAFDRIIAANKIVVVAAGNSNIDAGSFSPANCNGVIVAGATTRDGRRATYSNYGPRVNIMAPGGDSSNGVLSLGKDDDRNYSYSLLVGTSMASPHIAGIASLMKTLKPDITQAQVLQALAASAKVLNDAQCDAGVNGITLSSRDCGAGLVDAARALEAINNPTTPNPTPTPTPAPTPTDLAGMQVFACPSVANNECTPTQQVTVAGQGETVSYLFKNLPAGEYVIVAWKDINGNNVQDAGDIEGVYGNVSVVRPPASSIDFTATITSGVSALRVSQ